MADRQRSPLHVRFPLRVAVAGGLLVIGGALFAACGGSETCNSGTCVSQSGTRLIDRICRQSLPGGAACEASGGAVRTTGITGDSSGYQLNGAAATLTVHLEALEAVDNDSGSFGIDVLAASSDGRSGREMKATLTWGDCTSCGQDPGPLTVAVRPDYAWIAVVAGQNVSTQAPPYSSVLTLTGNDVDLADIRTRSVYPDTGCSIAGPIGAPR